MSAKRKILIAAASIAGTLMLAGAALLSTPLQTRLARRALAQRAGPGATLESASARWGKISLEGLRISTGGAVLTVPSLEARMDVLPVFLGRNASVTRLVAQGWTLDLSQPREPGSPAGGGGNPAQGGPWVAGAIAAAFRAFNVPARASLDGLDLEGTILLSDEDGRPIGKARVVLTGGGLAPGREGRFHCGTSALVDDPQAPVSSLTLGGDLTAAMDEAGAFTRADMKMVASAAGRQFPRGIVLSGSASAVRSAGNVSYSLALERGADEVAAVDARTNGDPRRIAGAWRLDLRDTDLAPFALGRRLPEFTVAGEGRYDGDAASGDVHALGKLKVSADRLGVLAPRLSALGRLDGVADFDMARIGSSLRVDRLETAVSGEGPVASLLALQPFEFNTATGELKVARPSGDLVGISVKGVPMAWLVGPSATFGVKGSDLRGEFAMRAEDGRLALRTKSPLTSSSVAVSCGASPVAADLELSAFVLADYAAQGWQVQLAPLSVRSQGVKLLSIDARFGRLLGTEDPIKAAGTWGLSLPALTALPAGARLPRLSGGDAGGSFEASLGATREVRVKLTLSDLALASGGPMELPTVTGEVRADVGRKGRTSFNAPLRLSYAGRISDLVLSGTFGADDAGSLFDVTLSGGRLSAEDLAVVAALSGVQSPEAPETVPGAIPAATPSRAPFWPAVRGRVAVRLDALACPRFELAEVRGALSVTPDALELAGATANFASQGRVRFGGKLTHAGGDAMPYGFQGAVSVENLDSVPFFEAIDPGREPVIEGRFDLMGLLRGGGTGLRDLVDSIQGDCTLSSKGGVFRALRTGAIEPLKQAQSKLGDALDTVTALFGKRADKTFQAVIDVAEGLSEIHFDQMSLHAERGADLDIHVTEISLLAPDERITGTGTVTYAKGVPVGGQPLSVDLELGVRGKPAALMGDVDMLKDGRDELGYARLYQTIHLGGTLGDIDQSQWREMLIRAPLRKAGGLFDKLLGR